MKIKSYLPVLILWFGICRIMAGQLINPERISSHGLSASGESHENCFFCHTQHGRAAKTVMWDVKISDTVYNIYQSSSLEARVGQPTGSSKLCLSCHDGTVASSESFRKGIKTYEVPGGINLGTDLSDDHPISFAYTSSLAVMDRQIRPPEMLPEFLVLDRNSEMQCTTCHDPHNNMFGNFLVIPIYQSVLCTSCHELPGWVNSVHQLSPAAVLNANDAYLQRSEFATVGENGCHCCHRSHAAGGHQRLLHFAKEEDNCLSCHNGTVARKNLQADLLQSSRHDVSRYDGVHDLKEAVGASARHVECVDCHNPHAVQSYAAQAPQVSGRLFGVSGITQSGGVILQALNEYEVCFKCHGDNPGRIDTRITRLITQTNTRLEFATANPSFHPVISPGVNQNVPSLISGIDVSTLIYCTDCHSSNQEAQTKGPHGSKFSPLLAYNYMTEDQTDESPYAYELCYQCHSRNSILADESFTRHKQHLDDKIPCSACHDPHGISLSQGSARYNSHLINFDVSIVGPDPGTQRLEFEDLGTFRGQCYLLCHGKQHSGAIY